MPNRQSEPGVGKTAVVEGLARVILRGDVLATDKDKQLCTLDLGPLWPAPVTAVTSKSASRRSPGIRTRGDIILFIDEIHTLVGAGAAEGAIVADSILKLMLARGELQTIGGYGRLSWDRVCSVVGFTSRGKTQGFFLERGGVVPLIAALVGLGEYEQGPEPVPGRCQLGPILR